jgi:hypothetical protein
VESQSLDGHPTHAWAVHRVVGALLVSVVLVVGCSGSPAPRPTSVPPSPTTSGPQPSDVTLVFQDGYNAMTLTVYTQRVQQFKAMATRCFQWNLAPASMGGSFYEFHLQVSNAAASADLRTIATEVPNGAAHIAPLSVLTAAPTPYKASMGVVVTPVGGQCG